MSINIKKAKQLQEIVAAAKYGKLIEIGEKFDFDDIEAGFEEMHTLLQHSNNDYEKVTKLIAP